MKYNMAPRMAIWIMSLGICPLIAGEPSESLRFQSAENSALTITVGGAGADITGFSSEAIQQAVDELKVRGGGVVRLTPGVFHIKTPVRLYSLQELVGSGPETVLRKIDGFSTQLLIDADYGERQLTVADPSGFEPGMAVHIYDALMFCGYRHLKVDHGKHFSQGRVYINGLEGFWSWAKERLRLAIGRLRRGSNIMVWLPGHFLCTLKS